MTTIPNEAPLKYNIGNSIIIGSLLGDGSIERSGTHGKGRWLFAESHTEKQKEYIEWKARLIPDSRIELLNRSFGKVYRLRTKPDEIYLKLRNEWYPNGRKIIPKSLMNTMDETVLAVWYMDDGDKPGGRKMKYLDGNSIRNNARIATAGFSYKENLFLRRILHKRFGIQPEVKKDGEYYRLYFKSKDRSFDGLMETIKKAKIELPNCMRYKIGERVESRRGITQRIILSKGLIDRDNGKFVSKRCTPINMANANI